MYMFQKKFEADRIIYGGYDVYDMTRGLARFCFYRGIVKYCTQIMVCRLYKFDMFRKA